jgi:hypothetical protein
VLAYLKRDDQVKASIECEWLAQVEGQKRLGRDVQCQAVYVIAIDSQDVVYPMPEKYRQPSAHAAAYVHYRLRLNELEHEGDDNLRRAK